MKPPSPPRRSLALFKQILTPADARRPAQENVLNAHGVIAAQAVRHLARIDPVMRRLIKSAGPCRWKPEPVSPFTALVEAVVYQQLNGKVATLIMTRVKALFPGRRFPTPADFLAMTGEKLRGAGLSRAKLAAIKDISAKTLAGVVPTSRAIARMTDEEIVERLTAIRGVGRWTVEMLLIFKLGRPDVLPVTDYGVRKGYALAYQFGELPKPSELLTLGEHWRPFRTVATWYLWRAVELAKSTQ